MRARYLIAAFAALGLALLGPAPALAEAGGGESGGPEVHLTEEQFEELLHTAEAESSLSTEETHCVAEQAEKFLAGEAIATCEEAPNPILPATNEIIWAVVSFSVLFFLIAKFGFPAIRKGLEGREEAVRNDLEAAEKARLDGEETLAGHRRQLAEARNEAAKIIDEARQAADGMRREVQDGAEAETAAARERAQAEIDQTVARARADLQREVADFAVQLAERIVERNLDRDAQMALVDQYIAEVGGLTAGGRPE